MAEKYPDPHRYGYDFCPTDHTLSVDEVINPYDEDHYCCWCGYGNWRGHGYTCLWADTHEGVHTPISELTYLA